MLQDCTTEKLQEARLAGMMKFSPDVVNRCISALVHNNWVAD